MGFLAVIIHLIPYKVGIPYEVMDSAVRLLESRVTLFHQHFAYRRIQRTFAKVSKARPRRESISSNAVWEDIHLYHSEIGVPGLLFRGTVTDLGGLMNKEPHLAR